MKKFFKVLGIGFASVLGLVTILVIGTIITFNLQLVVNETYDYQTNAPGQYVTIDDYDLHYTVIGEASDEPPLLFLHGFNAAGSHEWSKIAPFLTDHQLILVDHLGMGYSERVPELDPILTYESQSALYAKFIETLGFDEVNLVGVSYAGALAAQLALDEPDLINKLILLGPQLIELGGGDFGKLSTIPFGIGTAMTYLSMGAGFMGTELYALDCTFEPIGFCPDETDRAIRQRQAQIIDTTATFVAYSKTPIVTDIPQALPDITVPTLIIYGSGDEAQGKHAATIQNLMPEATFVEIAGAYHTPHLQLPAETAVPINQFLAN